MLNVSSDVWKMPRSKYIPRSCQFSLSRPGRMNASLNVRSPRHPVPAAHQRDVVDARSVRPIGVGRCAPARGGKGTSGTCPASAHRERMRSCTGARTVSRPCRSTRGPLQLRKSSDVARLIQRTPPLNGPSDPPTPRRIDNVPVRPLVPKGDVVRIERVVRQNRRVLHQTPSDAVRRRQCENARAGRFQRLCLRPSPSARRPCTGALAARQGFRR